VIDYYVVV